MKILRVKGLNHCLPPQVLIIGDEEYPPYMRPPLSKELWYCDDEELVSDLKFKQWKISNTLYEYSKFFEVYPSL